MVGRSRSSGGFLVNESAFIVLSSSRLRVALFADYEFFWRLTVNKRTFLAVVLLGLIAASPLVAHHSLAGVYDLNKVERATGVVQKFAFTNPHGALHIAIKNAAGEAKVWQLTTGSANVLTNAGVTATGPNRVKNGDTIEVTFNPAINGATIGFLRSIVLPGKKEVEFVPN